MVTMECLLCRSRMLTQCDEVFSNHMEVQHRAFSHHQLLFQLSRLDQAGLTTTRQVVNNILDDARTNIVEPKPNKATTTNVNRTPKYPNEQFVKEDMVESVENVAEFSYEQFVKVENEFILNLNYTPAETQFCIVMFVLILANLHHVTIPLRHHVIS